MIYFISDIHLGSLLQDDQHAHERKLVRWLEMAAKDAEKIIFLGDVFDFWFEYKTVVPKGFVRVLGKVADLVDRGIEIHFFTGNHDIWAFNYFEKEVGMIVHHDSCEMTLMGKQFFLSHGDGLNDKSRGFKLISSVFNSVLAQRLFGLVPPRLGQALGYAWSKQSRMEVLKRDNSFKGEENEPLVLFSRKYIQSHSVDFLVFGHRHLDLKLQLRNQAEMIILGDFYSIFSYGKFDGSVFHLELFEN